MNTRSKTNAKSQFQELPQKTNRKIGLSIEIPTPTILKLKNPDTISPISKKQNNPIAVPQLKRFVLDPKSSEEWMKNKKRLDNGNYVYLCGKPNLNSGKKCMWMSHDMIGLYSGCSRHYMWEENLNKYMEIDF